MVEDKDDELHLRYLGFIADLVRLEQELAELDVKREDTRKQVEATRRIVAELAVMGGFSVGDNLSTFGFTDACRAIIQRAYPEYISAKDIKERLEQKGFDLSQYSNPYASIYTILGRLQKSEFAETKWEGLNVLYRWKKRVRPRLSQRRARAIRAEVKKLQQ